MLTGHPRKEAKAQSAARLAHITRILHNLHERKRCEDASVSTLIATLGEQCSILESSLDSKIVVSLACACIPKGLVNRDSINIMSEAFEEYASGEKKRLPDADSFLDTVIEILDIIAADSSTDSSAALHQKIDDFIKACATRGITVEKEALNESFFSARKVFIGRDVKAITHAAINCIPDELKDGDSIKKMSSVFAPYAEGAKPLPSVRKLSSLVLATLNEIITAIPGLTL